MFASWTSNPSSDPAGPRPCALVVGLWLSAPAALAAPGEMVSRLPESPLSAGNLVETALGLVLVLAVMLGLAWLVKRYGQVPGIGKGQVQVLGGVSLGSREKAVLLSIEGRRLLVGVAPGRVQTLLVLAEGKDAPADFAEQLAAVSEGRSSTAGSAAGGEIG